MSEDGKIEATHYPVGISELEALRIKCGELIAENERLNGLINELLAATSADKSLINELANTVKDMDDYINTRGAHGEQ